MNSLKPTAQIIPIKFAILHNQKQAIEILKEFNLRLNEFSEYCNQVKEELTELYCGEDVIEYVRILGRVSHVMLDESHVTEMEKGLKGEGLGGLSLSNREA